jgi:hypothetical protein
MACTHTTEPCELHLVLKQGLTPELALVPIAI